MEQQRPLRLGDLVDDYCPKERRITNHAIVAIVEDTIRQTRCTACDADHVYKGGKAPARRKPKEQTGVLYEQVLTNLTTSNTPVPEAEPPAEVAVETTVLVAVAEVSEPSASAEGDVPAEPVAAAAVTEEPSTPTPVIDEGWSLNRRLIRASLPRVDGQPPAPRAIPEFTMHQRNVRGSQQFRSGGYGGNGNGNGWHDRGNGNSNGHRNGFRPDGQGDGQPGAPNGHRPGGGGRRRRRHKSHRPPQN